MECCHRAFALLARCDQVGLVGTVLMGLVLSLIITPTLWMARRLRG